MLRLIQFEMANRSHLPCASSTGSLSTTRLRLQLSPNTKNSVRGNVGTRTPSVITASKFHVELVRKGSVGKSVVVGESVTLVGSAVDSGLKLSVEGVGEKHAALRKGNGRLFCTALLGEGDMMADTSTWLNASQLRSGIEYLVPSGGELAFGCQDEIWIAEFEEAQVDDSMAKLMMNAMAQGANEEVRKKINEATS